MNVPDGWKPAVSVMVSDNQSTFNSQSAQVRDANSYFLDEL